MLSPSLLPGDWILSIVIGGELELSFIIMLDFRIIYEYYIYICEPLISNIQSLILCMGLTNCSRPPIKTMISCQCMVWYI